MILRCPIEGMRRPTACCTLGPDNAANYRNDMARECQAIEGIGLERVRRDHTNKQSRIKREYQSSNCKIMVYETMKDNRMFPILIGDDSVSNLKSHPHLRDY